MIKPLSRFTFSIFLIPFIFTLLLGSFPLDLHSLTINQNDKLIGRIAKDFSKKFCNGIGFGLSEESAMKFAIKENIEIFKNNKEIANIDNKVLSEKIYISVIDNCAYPLQLSEGEWMSNFKNR
tara:strand:- start:19 stop:387 length:369 start_codon:yes stop_codon:yes gene_type:complete